MSVSREINPHGTLHLAITEPRPQAGFNVDPKVATGNILHPGGYLAF